MDEPAAAPPSGLPAHQDFTVVGIGASAGGLKGLLDFLARMPPDSGMAFVIILHLSPKHESNLDQLLQSATTMPVIQVTEAVRIRQDHVYVISPAQQLSMVDGMLHVSGVKLYRGCHTAIDHFFRTLGETRKTAAICVVLSGTGSDGAVGLKAIKEQGGLTLVQDPDEAEYDGMPRSAIGTGMVDFVMPIGEMPAKLISLDRNSKLIELPVGDERRSPEASRITEAALRDVLTMLRVRTGNDFSQYKRATMLRRIERRLQVNQLRDLPTYRDFLRDNAQETRPLLKDMLISVTNFFRDRAAFEALERIAIPGLFGGKSSNDQVRVWVAGCATGEEAYSIAMLLAEYAAELTSPPGLQVFATDIDEDAIAVARAGVYPEAIATDVPPGRLRRFFVKETGGYRVQKSIREIVLFAVHDLIKDPPFSRNDLVACRNLLIYLNREIQGRVLGLMHFSLRPGGFMMLGTSESVDDEHDMFVTIDKAHRLYRAQLSPRTKPRTMWLPSHAQRLRVPAAHVTPTVPRRGDAYGEVHQRLLESYAPPSVIVDDHNEIVHLSDSAAQFLQFTAGAPSLNVIDALLPAFRLDVGSALHQAFQTMARVEVRNIQMTRPTGVSYVDVMIQPVRDTPTARTFALIIFDERDGGSGKATGDTAKAAGGSASAAMQGELASTREQLRATAEQYETQNEELKASNAELQAINEELRATSEELETSKEELQSINEELTTVNHELKSKIDEMTSINNDLHNFIASTQISVLFVDRGLRLTRFTPQAREFFNVIAADIGRPLLDITHRLDYTQLDEDVASVFDTLQPVERHVRSESGKLIMLRILPYRTADDRIDGAVLTFIDDTTQTEREEQLRRSENRYRAIIDSIGDYAIITTDLEGRIDGWNVGAVRIFGYSEQEIIGQSIDILFVPEDRATGAPERERETAATYGRAEDERWHLRKDGQRFYCSGVMAPLNDGTAYGFVKVARDLTDREIAVAEREQQFQSAQADRLELEQSNRLKDRFLATLSHELRNPLNLISMQSELMRRMPDTKASPALVRAVDIIHQTVKMQARLVDDLLDVSRISTGKLAVDRQLVPLPFIVGDSIGGLQHDMEQKQIALDVTLTPEPLIVQGDPVRIKQIAWNLLSNAVKFTPAGGRIAVRVYRDGNEARLDVEDNGKGISAEFMPRVFELFQQSDPGTTRRHSGMGIGLALVRQLVDLQGGRIEAHSAGENKGSRFTVWLPLYVAPDQPAARRSTDAATVAAGAAQAPQPADARLRNPEAPVDPTSNQPRRLEGIRVLIVDDDIASSNALRELLEEEGAKARATHSGVEALSVTSRHMFDVVVSDIAMPNMDGHTMLRKLRENPRYAEVPVIACTGFKSSEAMDQATRSGFATHLAKPVEMPELIVAIQTAIAGRNRNPPDAHARQ